MSALTTIILIEANSSIAAEVGWNLFLLYHFQFIILIIIRSFGALCSELPTNHIAKYSSQNTTLINFFSYFSLTYGTLLLYRTTLH